MKSLEGWILESFGYYKNPNGISVTDIIDYVDFKNHIRYSDDEVLLDLCSLKKKGLVIERNNYWVKPEK